MSNTNDDEFHSKLLEVVRMFYNSNSLDSDSSFTYVEIGCPYNGEINPIHVHIYYKNGKKPTKEKAWKYEKE